MSMQYAVPKWGTLRFIPTHQGQDPNCNFTIANGSQIPYIDCDGDFTYWDLVEGYLENWDPYFPIELHLREKAYLRAQAFVILTIERNCDDDAQRELRTDG